jgi:hypothetical protein
MGNALTVNQASAGAYRRFVRVLAIGAVLLGSTSHGAAAAVVPPELVPTPATISADLLFNFTPPDPIHVSTFGFHDLPGPGGRLIVDSALFPSPFLFASVPTIHDFFFGRVSAVFDYEVVIIGPSSSVPVLVASSGQAQGGALPPPLGTGGFALTASWLIENASSGVTVFSEGIQTPQLSGTFSDSFDHTVSLNLTANQRYRVRMVADAAIANGFTNGGFGTAFARIDPVFSFAPGVGPEYSFVFSEGVGNSPASPAPVPGLSTFALMAAGLLTLGMFLKRVRRPA